MSLSALRKRGPYRLPFISPSLQPTICIRVVEMGAEKVKRKSWLARGLADKKTPSFQYLLTNLSTKS